jgi:hypothetical protein
MRSSAAFSLLIGSFGSIWLCSVGTRSARGWLCPPDTSPSGCGSTFIDESATGGPRESLGCVGAAVCGCGSVAILASLPTPLGSTVELFIPPAFAGPRGIPLIGTFPVPAEPAGRANAPIAAKPACPPPCPPRANEAAGGVKTMNNAIATLMEPLDIGRDIGSTDMIHWNGEALRST